MTPRPWSERPALPASDGDWLLPYLRRFGTVGGVVGSLWPRYAVLPPTAGQASDGELDPTLAATLQEVLGRHTGAPSDCIAALWEGLGGIANEGSVIRFGPGTAFTPRSEIGPALSREVVDAPGSGRHAGATCCLRPGLTTWGRPRWPRRTTGQAATGRACSGRGPDSGA